MADSAPGAGGPEHVTRDQLEHIVRAAAYIVDDDELIVVGSQAMGSVEGEGGLRSCDSLV